MALAGVWACAQGVGGGRMKRFVVIVGMLLAAACTYASPIPGPDYTNPVSVTLLSFSGGQWQNGYPYTLSMLGPSALFKAMCDDYTHGGSIGESWQANITNLGSNNLTLTRFGHQESALGLAFYHEAGWILLQTPVTPSSEYQDMNYAVWHIFDPDPFRPPGERLRLGFLPRSGMDPAADTGHAVERVSGHELRGVAYLRPCRAAWSRCSNLAGKGSGRNGVGLPRGAFQ